MIKWLITLVAGGSLLIWSIAAVDTSHAHTWLEKNIPGFWSFFGFCSCLVLIYVVKWLKKSGIQRKENYYDS